MSSVPVLIACRDRLTPLVALVDWLERAGCERIVLVDNDSAYPPLLEYYERSPHTVVRLGENVGPQQFWAHGVIAEHARGERYVLTDPDVVPDEACPLDALDHFAELLDRHPDRRKVGFGLRIDDLPDRYQHADAVRAWEAQFWQHEVEPGVYDADVDSTFALYRDDVTEMVWGPALRTGAPYVARHMPWYADGSNATDEDRYYHERYLRDRRTHTAVRTTWNDQRLPHKISVRLGLAKPRSAKPWARAGRFLRNGFRRSAGTDY